MALGLLYPSLMVLITRQGSRWAHQTGDSRPGAAVSAHSPIALLRSPHLVVWLVAPIRALIGRGLAAGVAIAPDVVDPNPFLRSGVWDIVAWGCATAAGFGVDSRPPPPDGTGRCVAQVASRSGFPRSAWSRKWSRKWSRTWCCSRSPVMDVIRELGQSVDRMSDEQLPARWLEEAALVDVASFGELVVRFRRLDGRSDAALRALARLAEAGEPEACLVVTAALLPLLIARCDRRQPLVVGEAINELAARVTEPAHEDRPRGWRTGCCVGWCRRVRHEHGARTGRWRCPIRPSPPSGRSRGRSRRRWWTGWRWRSSAAGCLAAAEGRRCVGDAGRLGPGRAVVGGPGRAVVDAADPAGGAPAPGAAAGGGEPGGLTGTVS